MPTPDPHADQPVLRAGAPLDHAAGAVVLLHGRGASAADILGLAEATDRDDLAFLAPQAAGHTWYPLPFTAPMEANEPFLSSALRKVATVVGQVEAAGIPRERILLGGFSQGACLTSEFAARNAARWGGVAVLAGGLIGPPGTPRDYPGRFDGTPAFLGVAEADPHIGLARVKETDAVFEAMGAAVDTRIYPGTFHALVRDQLDAFAALLRDL